MSHKFTVGATVDLTPRVLRAAALGPYQVVFLVPASDTAPDEPLYRIKAASETHERVAPESELSLSSSHAAAP